MLSRNLVCFAAILFGVSLTAKAGNVTAPDWVRQVASQSLPTYPPETKAVVLLDQTDYTVTAPGEFIEHSRSVIKILRPDGREEGDLLVDLGHEEKLNSVHAWSIDRAGHEYELKQKDFQENSIPSFELYSDVRFLSAKAPAAQPGTVIAFEWEARRHAYVNQINQYFQESNPVREVRISLTLPAGWEFKDFWPVGSPVAPVQTYPNRWEWVAHDLNGIEEEPMMPRMHTLLGRLSIAYFPTGQNTAAASWQALGRWYTNLTAGRRDVTPQVSQQVEKLLSGKTTFDSRLQTLTSFLQSEIRYVAIEIGVGGYQPHSASDVFRYHYGDCKDKATLLSTMLKVAGINSDYILIDTDRGFVNPSLPSAWFNHAILAIEIPDEVKADHYPASVSTKSGKRYIIFDPTDEYTPVGSLRAELQNTYALLVTDAGGELIRTPTLQPESNQITRIGHFVLSPDGALSGEVSEDREGDFATEERYRLHSRDQREQTTYFEGWIGHSMQGFTLGDIGVKQQDQREKDLLINYKLATSQYGQLRGSLMLFRPRVLDNKSTPVEHKPRHFAIELERTSHETDQYEIELPKDYQVDDVPEPVKIDVGFASYQSKIEIQGSKLNYWREYVVRDFSVPPEKFSDWVKLQGTIGADEAAAVVLKRVQ